MGRKIKDFSSTSTSPRSTIGERSQYGDMSISTIPASLLWNQSPSVGARIALHWRRRLRRRFLFGGSMEYTTPPSPRLTRAGKQVQPASRSTPRSADTATLRTLERRIGTEIIEKNRSNRYRVRSLGLIPPPLGRWSIESRNWRISPLRRAANSRFNSSASRSCRPTATSCASVSSNRETCSTSHSKMNYRV